MSTLTMAKVEPSNLYPVVSQDESEEDRKHESDKSVEDRETWTGKLDFILASIGYAVGLGNVWRFPYLCGRNGGAAFLIPYFIMMIFCGLPVFYLDSVLGQYTSMSSILVFPRMSPIFSGIGHCQTVSSLYTAIYYNMIIAWAIYYFGASFSGIGGNLPWRYCNNEWNNEWCYDDKIAKTCNATLKEVYYMGHCYDAAEAQGPSTNASISIARFATVIKEGKGQTPAQQYHIFHVLDEGTGFDDYGWPKWDLVLVLFIAWLLVSAFLAKGVKSSGKVVYFTATFPYVLLIILLIRGNMLDGASDGVDFFIKPNWTQLGQSRPWVDAAQQIFFSLSLSNGGLTTLASYNKFNNNIFRDTLIVVLGNSATSILAGFTIFPIIGFAAKSIYPEMNPQERVAKFAESGPSLAFIAYPDALDRLPAPWIWCILFFFMLILIGVDSQLVIVETVTIAIVDSYPKLRPWKKRLSVTGCVSLFCFLVGLILCAPVGTYVLNLMDSFAGGLPLLLSCLFELALISYVYGIKRFIGNIRDIHGEPPNLFWKLLGYPVNYFWTFCWLGITPAIITGTMIMFFVKYERTSQGDYVFPIWAEVLGWCITMSCMGWIPGFAIYHLIKTRNWNKLSQPTPEWGTAAERELLTLKGKENEATGVNAAKVEQ